MGSCPVFFTNVRKSSGLKPMVAALVIGWKYTFSCPPSKKAESRTNFTSPSSQNSAKGVAQPEPTFSFSSMAVSSANRRFPLPTPNCLARSFKLTCRSWRTVTSQKPFFFLSLRNKFLLCAPFKCWTWGIISSTVNTCKMSHEKFTNNMHVYTHCIHTHSYNVLCLLGENSNVRKKPKQQG